MYISSIYRSALKGKITRSFLYLQNELMLYLECLGASASVKIPFSVRGCRVQFIFRSQLMAVSLVVVEHRSPNMCPSLLWVFFCVFKYLRAVAQLLLEANLEL